LFPNKGDQLLVVIKNCPDNFLLTVYVGYEF
jgi:hypothetical protein